MTMNFELQVPSIMIFSASPKSGKSFLIKDIIYKLASEGKIDHGLVFTNTSFNHDYSYLPDRVVSQYDENRLKRFIKYQKERVEMGKPKSAFLILDDILGSINLNAPLWQMLFSQYRHFHITIFLSTQYIYRVGTVSRECATYAFMFQQRTFRSLQALYETYGQMCETFNEFKAIIMNNCKDYQVLMFINNQPTKEATYRICKAKKRDFKLDF